jgi:predicted RNA-binding protein with PUA-like domain
MATKRKRRCWLMKTEPDVFSFADLVARGERGESWDGVRNYQARNTMRDDMKLGDRVLLYHSRATPPHVAGVAEVIAEAHPDPSCWDPASDHFDPKSTREAPRWFMVDIKALAALPHPVSLEALKANPKLAKMVVVQRGQRLSVQPVTAEEYAEVLAMGELQDP